MAYSKIKTGSYIIINKHPCKIVKVNISSTGKHGHTKKLVVGKDLITNKKYEALFKHSSNIEIPIVNKDIYELVDIHDNYLDLIDNDGIIRSDIPLPDNDLGTEICNLFSDGHILDIHIVKVEYKAFIMEKVIDLRIQYD